MEYFKPTDNNIGMSADKRTVSHTAYSGTQSLYGSFTFGNDTNTITKWTFKIISLGVLENENICIGIDSSNNKGNIPSCFYINKGTYGYSSDGWRSSGTAYENGNKISGFDGDKYGVGDTIIMVHNAIDSTLIFSKKGKDGKTKQYLPIPVKRQKYKLCIYFSRYAVSVKLTDFKRSKQKVNFSLSNAYATKYEKNKL